MSTIARDTMIPELTEMDSDGSSGEERDARKRVGGDTETTGPKKRRKQTTPVRFSSSLTSDPYGESNEEGEELEDDEEEEEDEEGKVSSTRSPGLPLRSNRDENLNSEFRCQYCAMFFDNKDTLNVHMNAEHGQINPSRSPSTINIKLEPSTEQNESPVNLLSVKNFANSWLTVGHVQSQTQTQIQSQLQSQLQAQSQGEEWSTAVGQLPTISNHLQSLPGFPGTLAQYLPLPGYPLTDSSHLTRPSLGPTTPVRIFNPDAYCDLCNKEFCNKYFLKTHKANKHGIYVDSPGPSSADNSLVPPTIFPANFSGNPVKLEPPATPPTPNIPCDVCQKRFKNDESMRKHKQKVHGDGIEQSDTTMSLPASEEDRETARDSPSAMEGLFKQEFGMEQEDTSFMPAPRHLSPQASQQARESGFNVDRLRRLGVINPEAFCEICCKEYCNKYFLRTHKMKRHGIIVQDNEKSPGGGSQSSSGTWHQVQTSPLNLIVTETATNGSESSDRSDDYECKPCGIRFQTIGLYQAHCRKIHETDEQGRESPRQDFEAEGSDQRGGDSISEDLQKLQTMILQLNGLESTKGACSSSSSSSPPSSSSCNICGKECESKMVLRIHMSTEHGGININSEEQLSPPPQEKSPLISNVPTAFCTLCEKDYSNQDSLRKHIAEEHQSPSNNAINLVRVPLTPTTSASSTPSNPTPNERKVTSLTPTSSYCEICNKELCNKYFMKTHMQRMHGIEIENGAQIGGVICNICNKELCSKYFLRVHKHNTHGIVDENNSTANKQESFDASSSDDPALKPEQLGDLSHRYFTHFTEVCPICSRRFRSIKWLKAHLMGDHGKVGIDKWRELEQQYQSTSKNANRAVTGVTGATGVAAPAAATPSKNTQQQGASLKIPNGFETNQQVKSTDYAGLGNQILSNLFGSSSDDNQMKSYRCSYCSFTTPVLPFLFLHERSHVNPQENVEGDRSLQCPICSQNFHQPELLHQHLLTRHQFPSLLSHFQPPILGNLRLDIERLSDSKDRPEQESNKEEMARVSPHIPVSQTIPEPVRNKQRQDDTAVQVTPQGAYKCAQCGYATTNLNRIKRHVRKDHNAMGDATDSVIAELSKTLKDVANKHKVPACYAMPQDMNFNPDKTIMQPFLIEEHDSMQLGEESRSEKRFTPALVYLPVKTRINSALTASFTLSPA